jgi:ribosome-associated heat shock protein Hsp15
MTARSHPAPAAGVRLDKWLWAARFFKTRVLAQQAVEGGRVRLNGERCKSSRELRPGDRLSIRINDLEWQVTVLALSSQRGPAPVAQQLYGEDAASAALRQSQLAARKAGTDPGSDRRGRPTKRDRRLLHRFTESA